MSDALADEMAIRRVLATYAHAIDRTDFELIAGCYCEDAEEDRGRFKGSIPEFIEWLTKTLGEPWIELDGDVAHVDTPCLGHHRLRNPAPGRSRDELIPCRYLDRFERRDGEWRIASRRAVYEPVLAVSAGPDLT